MGEGAGGGEEVKIGTVPILFGIIIVLRKAKGNRLLLVNIPHEGL